MTVTTTPEPFGAVGQYVVLEECPALVHNTLRAAMQGQRNARCVCPHTLYLREAAGKAGARPLPEAIVLPHCRAPRHNTSRSALHGPAELRCVCPRALEYKRRHNNKVPSFEALQRALEPKKTATGTKAKAMRVDAPGNPASAYMTNTLGGKQPEELERGACRSVLGMRMMDLLLDTAGRSLSRERQFKEELCDKCPLSAFNACRAWVRRDELPAGAWGGIYAGMTQEERAADAALVSSLTSG